MMRAQISTSFMRRCFAFVRRFVVPTRAAKKRPAAAQKKSNFPRIDRLQVDDQVALDGHVFDRGLQTLEAAAIAHQPTQDWGPDYGVVKAAFDPLFYLSQNPDIRRLGLDPIGHYLRAGARENRDPAPWFSTSEYRRAYLGNEGKGQANRTNPFAHYLSIGRATGHSPRKPVNYDIFCASLGRDCADVSALVEARMEDVRGRLRDGALGEMVAKAALLDPLIEGSWRAGFRVRVPPASNAIGVRRIGHLIDLQDQAKKRRAKVVIVANGARLMDPLWGGLTVFRQIAERVPHDQIVVICTDGNMPDLGDLADVRLIDFMARLPRAKDYQPARTLVEFTRSLRPETVINLDAKLMNSALKTQGKAIAATSIVYQFLQSGNAPDARAKLGARYYRAIDLRQRVIVQNGGVRDDLADRFSLLDQAKSEIWALDDATPPQTAGQA